jgi:hypothetical protein
MVNTQGACSPFSLAELKNLPAIDRNPVKMFSYFIRCIGMAKGGCATMHFGGPGFVPGFGFYGTRISAYLFRTNGRPICWVTLGDLGSNWVKPGGRAGGHRGTDRADA